MDPMDPDPLFAPGQRVRVERCADPDPLPAGATGTVQRWNPDVRQLDVDWDAPYHTRRLIMVLEDEHDAVSLLPDFDPQLLPVRRLVRNAEGVHAQHYDRTASWFASAEAAREACGNRALRVYTPAQADTVDALTEWITGSADNPDQGTWPGFAELRQLLARGDAQQAAGWLEHWLVHCTGEPLARGWWSTDPVSVVRITRAVGARACVPGTVVLFRPGDLALATGAEYPSGADAHGFQGLVTAYSMRYARPCYLPDGSYEVADRQPARAFAG